MKRIILLFVVVFHSYLFSSVVDYTATMDSVLVANLREAVDSDGINDDEVMDFYYEMIDPNRYEEGNDFGRDILWEYWYDPFGADGYNVRPHMAICADGGFAVTGYYIIEDFMGGYLEWQGYVLKTDSEGNFLWADKDTLDFMGDNESRAIVETSDGSIINGGGGYMIKRDCDGNRIWNMQTDIAIYSMINDDGNTIVLTGTSYGILVFRKIDEDGNEIWNKDLELGERWTTGYCVIKTSDGGYAITGYVSDEQANNDVLVIKANSLGDTLWTYRYDHVGDNDEGNWILENSNNRLIVVGEVDIPGSVRGYYAKFELDGELLHEEILDPDIGYNCFYAIDIPEDNSLMITAAPYVVKCDYDFNIEWIQHWSDIFPYYRKLSDGYFMYYNGVHFKRTDSNIMSILDNTIPEMDESLKIYPNPFNPITTLSFNLPKEFKNGFLIIYNIKGQKVRKFNINKDTKKITWDGTDQNIKELSSGIYFATIYAQDRILAVKKITLIK